MVGAHAGVAHAAEAHVVVRQVDDHVVDGGASERQLADHTLLHGFVVAEHVRGQGFLERAHDGERLVQRLVRDDRQHRSEYLLVHDGSSSVTPRRHVGSMRSVPASPRPRTPPWHPGCDVRSAHHAFEVALADHVRPFVAREDVLAVILVEARVQLPHEVVRHALVHEKVVGRDARLPAVDALAPGHALRCALHVRRFVHDAGTLAAQLQHHGREVLRRRSMMAWPTFGLPVKNIWSQRTSSSQSFIAPEPGKPQTNSGGNTFDRISSKSSLVCFDVREGLSATQLPAAMASTMGTSVQLVTG